MKTGRRDRRNRSSRLIVPVKNGSFGCIPRSCSLTTAAPFVGKRQDFSRGSVTAETSLDGEGTDSKWAKQLLAELADGLEMQPVDPKKYVPRFCSELELSEEVESKGELPLPTQPLSRLP